MPARRPTGPALLCVVGFPANTGFAWDFLEGLYARMSGVLEPAGIRTYVAYPRIESPPATLADSAAVPVELDASLASGASLSATREFVRERDVRALFFIDRPSFNHRYAAIRRAGVRRIVVYDHTSGTRTPPRGLKRLVKRATRAIPPWLADEVLVVSDYVARRQVDIALMPAARVRTVHNGLDVPPADPDARERLRSRLGIDETAHVVGCAARAAPEKGIEHLLRAFDIACGRLQHARPHLVFFGDGPDLERLRGIAAKLEHAEHVHLPGYRAGAADLLEGADVCAVPSVWEDALPLAVLGAMARGNAVVASRVGGVPEMIEDGVSGLLVPPRDEAALANGLVHLLEDRELRRSLGAAARRRVARRFRPEDQIEAMCAAVRPAFEGV